MRLQLLHLGKSIHNILPRITQSCLLVLRFVLNLSTYWYFYFSQFSAPCTQSCALLLLLSSPLSLFSTFFTVKKESQPLFFDFGRKYS